MWYDLLYGHRWAAERWANQDVQLSFVPSSFEGFTKVLSNLNTIGLKAFSGDMAVDFDTNNFEQWPLVRTTQ